MYTSYYTNFDGNIPVKSDSPLAAINYIVIDVDGTLTDGGIYYDEQGNEFKKFCTKDAAGFFAAKICGITTLVITGRKCKATERRMQELQVGELFQGIVDKTTFLKEYMNQHGISKEQLAYIGDDLNDYSGMMLAGFVACPKDAVTEILQLADYISIKKGGEGAVRDTVEYLLKERGQWHAAISECYKINTAAKKMRI